MHYDREQGMGARLTPYLIIGALAVAVYLMIRNSALGRLTSTVADTVSTAVSTVRGVGADLDPWNKRGKLHKAGDAAVKGVRTTLTAPSKAAKSAVKKLKRLF